MVHLQPGVGRRSRLSAERLGHGIKLAVMKDRSLSLLVLLTLGVLALTGAGELLCADDCCAGLGSGPCAPCPCCPFHALVTVRPEIGPAPGAVASFDASAGVLPTSPPSGVLHVPKLS